MASKPINTEGVRPGRSSPISLDSKRSCAESMSDSATRKRCSSEHVDDSTAIQPWRESLQLQESGPAHTAVRRPHHENLVTAQPPRDLTTVEAQVKSGVVFDGSGQTYQQDEAASYGEEGEEEETTVKGINRSPAKLAKRQLECYNESSTSKRPKQDSVGFDEEVGNKTIVENWLAGRSWSRQASVADPVLGASGVMPRQRQLALPSSKRSFAGSETASERSTASVHDSDYRQALRFRNIYIEREEPPAPLMERANHIISRPRASPEMDDAAIQAFKHKSRQLQEEAEDEVIQQLAPDIIEAMNGFPDTRLARTANQPWCNSIPIPLDSAVLTNPLPLPVPKPDLAFGYSESAFTRNQLRTIDLLTNGQLSRSFAVPDKRLRFPFLSVEFKSQAESGTHFVAINQVAGTGAIAVNGTLDLIQRSFGSDAYDYDEPQFFSVIMDHESARINVHWLEAPPQAGGQYSFHVEGLSKHFFDSPNDIRKIVRAIKNILEYGTDERLRKLCEALDAYRESIIRDTEVANQQLGGVMLTATNQEPTRAHAVFSTDLASDHAPSTDQQIGRSTEVRQTRSSSNAPPLEVNALRGKNETQSGWAFRLKGQQHFIPDDGWLQGMKGGRAAVFNSQYNVWCYVE